MSIGFWSTLIELVGTLVTAYGLAVAYGRAEQIPAQIRNWWDRTFRKRPPGTGTAQGTYGWTATVGGYAPFRLDATLPVPEQLALLENYVRELRGMFDPVNTKIAGLDRAIKQTKAHADTVAAQALAEAKAEIERFRDRLDELQAVDLRWAVRGVLITGVGVFLGFWA